MIGSLKAALGKRFWPIAYARRIGVKVGADCRLIQCEYGTEPYLISLGDRVSATSVRFETHDGGVWCMRDKHPKLDRVKPIRVGNNVYLGYRAMVMPGVTIGDGSIVGAYSIVTKDVPPNTVVAGVPARVIKSVAEYAAAALADGDLTKDMSAAQKEQFYRRKYGL